MKLPALLALLCLSLAGCNQSGGSTQETGRDIGGQTQGTSFPGSTGAGSQSATGNAGGGRANTAPNSAGTTGGGH